MFLLWRRANTIQLSQVTGKRILCFQSTMLIFYQISISRMNEIATTTALPSCAGTWNWKEKVELRMSGCEVVAWANFFVGTPPPLRKSVPIVKWLHNNKGFFGDSLSVTSRREKGGVVVIFDVVLLLVTLLTSLFSCKTWRVNLVFSQFHSGYLSINQYITDHIYLPPTFTFWFTKALYLIILKYISFSFTNLYISLRKFCSSIESKPYFTSHVCRSISSLVEVK